MELEGREMFGIPVAIVLLLLGLMIVSCDIPVGGSLWGNVHNACGCHLSPRSISSTKIQTDFSAALILRW